MTELNPDSAGPIDIEASEDFCMPKPFYHFSWCWFPIHS